MSKKIRDYLLILFLFVFLILTTIISLYASGYKFNLGWPPRFNKFLQKTGMLTVTTLPKGALIFLNGESVSSGALSLFNNNLLTTPSKIKGLLPGEYTLRLEQTNYWPFEKKITINSGQTTFIEDINLFSSSQPLFLVNAPAGGLQLSSSRKYLYLTGDKKIITLKNGQEKQLSSNSGQAARWLDNSDRLILGGKLFDVEKNTDLNYEKLIGQDVRAWYYEEKTGNLYYQTKDSISRLSPDGRTNTVILIGENYLSFEPRGNHLFVVVDNKNKIFLRDYYIKEQGNYLIKEQVINAEIELPTVGDYHFVDPNQPQLSLLDAKNQTLYLFDPANLKDSGETLKNAISWQWLSDNLLIYNNNWEIYYFDLKQNRAALLTRVSEEITGLFWHKNNNYLIFSTADSLNAVDLKTGTITIIFKTTKISAASLDDKNDILYFNAQIGQSAGVYKLLLQ